jgi:hypothetical protein
MLELFMLSGAVIGGSHAMCCLACPVCCNRFGLVKEELKDVDELLEEVTKKVHQLKPQRQSRSPGIPLVSLLGQPTCTHHKAARQHSKHPCLILGSCTRHFGAHCGGTLYSPKQH